MPPELLLHVLLALIYFLSYLKKRFLGDQLSHDLLNRLLLFSHQMVGICSWMIATNLFKERCHGNQFRAKLAN